MPKLPRRVVNRLDRVVYLCTPSTIFCHFIRPVRRVLFLGLFSETRLRVSFGRTVRIIPRAAQGRVHFSRDAILWTSQLVMLAIIHSVSLFSLSPSFFSFFIIFSKSFFYVFFVWKKIFCKNCDYTSASNWRQFNWGLIKITGSITDCQFCEAGHCVMNYVGVWCRNANRCRIIVPIRSYETESVSTSELLAGQCGNIVYKLQLGFMKRQMKEKRFWLL